MRLILIILFLWVSSFLATAQAQQTPVSYQFMHINMVYGRMYFSPAYQNREVLKVEEYMGESYRLFDKRQLGWEAMSRLLRELSGEGWELVNLMADNDKDGNRGAVYLLRRPVPAK